MKKILGVIAFVLLLWCGVSNAALPATDNFNRADVNPIGGNWTTITGQTAQQIVSYAVKGTSGTSGSYWNADTPNNDQYAQIKVWFTSGDYGAGPVVRCSISADTFYTLIVTDRTTAQIFKVVGGSWTLLGGSSITISYFNNGDLIRLEISGTTLTPIIAGTTYATRTDSAITSGMVGMLNNYNNAYTYLDDWEGGNLGGGTQYFSTSTLAQISNYSGVTTESIFLSETLSQASTFSGVQTRLLVGSVSLPQTSGIANSIYNTAGASYLLAQTSGYSETTISSLVGPLNLSQKSGYSDAGIELISLSETLSQASGYSTFGGNVYVSTGTLAQTSNFADSVLRTIFPNLLLAQSSGFLNTSIGQIVGPMALAQKSGLVQSSLLALAVSNALAQKSGYSSMGGNQYFLTETLAQISSFSDNALLLALLSEALSSASLYASASSLGAVGNQYFRVLTLNGMSFIIGNGSTWRNPVSPIVLLHPEEYRNIIHPEELRSIIHPTEDRVLRVMP